LRAFDVDKDIASCREDEIAVSAICKNEVAPPVWINGKVICKGAAGIAALGEPARAGIGSSAP
jgi:hypothetical protein